MTETANSPAHLMQLFAERAALGDLAGILELYEADAIFEDDSGTRHMGKGEIGEALAPLAGLKPQISYEGDSSVATVGDIALVSNVWSMKAAAPDGSNISMGGISADVVRRQAGGTWKILIDQPRGAPHDQ